MPVVKLTDKNVPKLPAVDGARTTYHDLVQEGLTLRVTPAGARTYSVIYRFNGQVRRFTIGGADAVSLAQARKKAAEVIAQAKLGTDAQAEKVAARRETAARAGAETFAEAAGRFLAEGRRKDGTPLRTNTLRSWQTAHDLRIKSSALGRMLPAEITRADVRRFLEGVPEGHRRNRALELVRRVFAWLLDRDEVSGSPCAGLSKAREEPRERFLTHDELRAVWGALDEERSPVEGAAWRLLFYCGLRLSEVLGAPRAEVDLAAGTWTIPGSRTKGRRAHVVPLSKPALTVLRKLDKLFGERRRWLVPSPADETRPLRTLQHSLVRLSVRSGVAGWSAHDTRRTVRSNLAAMGVAPYVAEKILGHYRRDIEATYNAHSFLPERRAALEAWADRLARIARGEDAGAEVVPFPGGVRTA